MTPTQEAVNAATTLLPVLALADQPVLLAGGLMHAPVSFAYHLGVAFGRPRLDNDLRRLDQSLQHVVGTLFAFALSCSLGYAALSLAVNLRGIYFLWHTATSNDGRRWVPVLVSVLLYTAPMVWRGDYENYCVAVASMAVGAAAFVPRWSCVFSCWGHAVFHVALVVHAQALAASSARLVSSEENSSEARPNYKFVFGYPTSILEVSRCRV